MVLIAGSLLSIPALAVPIGAEVRNAPPPDYLFGVFPYLPPRDLEKVFAPIRYLGPAAYAEELRSAEAIFRQMWQENPWIDK